MYSANCSIFGAGITVTLSGSTWVRASDIKEWMGVCGMKDKRWENVKDAPILPSVIMAHEMDLSSEWRCVWSCSIGTGLREESDVNWLWGSAIGHSGFSLHAANASTSLGTMMSVTRRISGGRGDHSECSGSSAGLDGIGAGFRIVTKPCFFASSSAYCESSSLSSSCTTRIYRKVVPIGWKKKKRAKSRLWPFEFGLPMLKYRLLLNSR